MTATTLQPLSLEHPSPPKISLEAFVLKLESLLGFKTKVVWSNVIITILVHIVVIWAFSKYGMDAKWQTVMFTYVTYVIGFFGVSAGPHRYWSHRSFKASTPLRIVLMLSYAICGQKPIHSWVRDHRIHHKYSDTDADPHNTQRGYFFAHIGCYLMKKHPDVVKRGREVDMSDIENDPIVRFHDRNFNTLKYVCSFLVPICTCTMLWNESLMCAFAWHSARFLLLLHTNFSFNSVAHAIGDKSYNSLMKATDNKLFITLFGSDGYHNYHHAFPWDYRTAEFGNFALCFTTPMLNGFKRLNLAWDFKMASPELVEKVALNRGDGTRKSEFTGNSHHHMHEEIPEDWQPENRD